MGHCQAVVRPQATIRTLLAQFLKRALHLFDVHELLETDAQNVRARLIANVYGPAIQAGLLTFDQEVAGAWNSPLAYPYFEHLAKRCDDILNTHARLPMPSAAKIRQMWDDHVAQAGNAAPGPIDVFLRARLRQDYIGSDSNAPNLLGFTNLQVLEAIILPAYRTLFRYTGANAAVINPEHIQACIELGINHVISPLMTREYRTIITNFLDRSSGPLSHTINTIFKDVDKFVPSNQGSSSQLVCKKENKVGDFTLSLVPSMGDLETGFALSSTKRVHFRECQIISRFSAIELRNALTNQAI